MNRRKIGWFIKILFSYLLLTAILLTCVGFPVIQNIRTIVEYEVLDNAERALNAVNAKFSDWCKNAEEYARQVKQDANMNPYRLSQDGYASMQARNDLRNTVIYGNQYDVIALVYAQKYFSGQPIVYSSESNIEGRTFFSYFFRYDQWDYQDIYNSMSSIDMPTLRIPEWVTVQRTLRERYLTYIVPIGALNTSGQRGIMLFLITNSHFKALMTSVSLPRGATLVMQDSSGNVVYTGDDSTIPEGSTFSTDGTSCKLGNKTYSYIHNNNTGGAWNFAILLPEDVVSEAIHARLANVLFILGIGVLLAIVASLALSNIIFRPVRRLKNIAQQIGNVPSDMSEFDQIEHTMTGLSHRNTDLLSQLHSQSAGLRQHILQSMFLGSMNQKDEFLTLVRENGIAFDENSLRVVELSIDHHEQALQMMNDAMRSLTRYGLLKILRENVKEYGMSGIGCESGNDYCVIAVLSGHVDDDANVRTALDAIRTVAEENFHFTLTVGVSEYFCSLDDLSRQYHSASEAVEQRYLHGCGQTYFASEVHVREAPDEEARRQLTRQEMRVMGTLREERYEESIAAVDGYVQMLRELQLSSACARHQILVLRSSVYQQINMLRGNTKTDWSGNYDTLDLMRDEIVTALHELGNMRGESGAGIHSELVERCIEYMRENIADQNLNMESIAAALDVSSGYVSRCFKAEMEITPWQYIDTLRLQRACQLLKGTSLHIGDILQACGYVDKTNFMRKFKRQYDMTPIEYRRINRAYDDENEDTDEKES